MDNKITEEKAIGEIMKPFRQFMLLQVREKDLSLFKSLADLSFKVDEGPKIDLRVLMPAFMIFELCRGFEIGFLIVLLFWS